MSDTKPVIHMVGSIPLDDSETVFKTLGQRVGDHAERIPDGETGRRQRWINFVMDQLKANPAFEVDQTLPPFQFTQFDGTVVYEIPRLTNKDGVDPKFITFETGYAGDGSAAKLETARKYATVSGVATECGMGRGDPEIFEPALDISLNLVG